MANWLSNTHEPHPKLIIGPRLEEELKRQIKQLEGRLKPTIYDLAELARLRELLKNTGDRPTQHLPVGARLLHEFGLELRELQSRDPAAMSRADKVRMHKLRVFCHLSKMGGEDGI